MQCDDFILLNAFERFVLKVLFQEGANDSRRKFYSRKGLENLGFC